jgi:hypothetical protein
MKETQKNKVKYADDITMSAKGKDGENFLISDVLYIPSMKCNLLSIDQFLEKNYKVYMEDRMLRVIDVKGNLVLKAPMSKNMTLKIKLDFIKHKCILIPTSRDKWR